MAIVLCEGPIDNSIFVHQFEYKMDGDITGTLSLLDSPRHDRLVAFESSRTGRKTPWHGSWSGFEGEPIKINFDFLGRPEKAAFKWAHVQYRQTWDEHQGDDHMNRRIQMKRQATLTFKQSVDVAP